MPTFTMRLSDEDYEALQAMSLLTGRPMAQLVRDAVASSITSFTESTDFERRYRAELRARRSALEKLRQRLTSEQQAAIEAEEGGAAEDEASDDGESEPAAAKRS